LSAEKAPALPPPVPSRANSGTVARGSGAAFDSESTMVAAAPEMPTQRVEATLAIGIETASTDEDDQPTRVGEAYVPPTVSVGVSPSSSAAASLPSRPSLSSLLDDDLSVGDSYNDELQEEAPDSYVGSVLGDRYVIDRVLGEGGMGKVYRAHHKVIDKKVAVKILHAELAKDKESVGRFLREARAASSIGNPHIVDIIDFGEADDGSTYFVMEFLNGQSLGDTLEELGKISAPTTVDLAIQICDGLAAAHAEGIVHRDLKPDNVVLVKPKGTWAGQGHFVKILDFGIAKVSGPSGNTSKLTMAGAVFGTPHYMSPEQAAGEVLDHRTDIYSLGVMMFEMLAGEMPFQAENFMGILTQHMYKAPPSLRAKPNSLDCPEALEAIVLKCMAKRPEARYQTMEELAADLLTFKQTGAAKNTHISSPSLVEPGAAVVSQPLPSGAMPSTSTPKRIGAVVGVASLLVGVGAAVLMLRPKAAPAVQAVATATAAEVAAAPPPSVTATATAAAAPGAEKAVLLYSDVANAYAMLGDRKLKLPETIKVPEGTTVTVRVEGGTGYDPTEVTVDGSNSKVKADPKKKLGTAGAMPGRPGIAPPPSTGIGVRPKRGNPDGVVDPW
jgi:serine/threonine protein kinase